MRNFVSLPILLSLSLASQGQALVSVPVGIPFGHPGSSLIDARDVTAAVKILRRANYNFDDHVFKRSDSWSWKENGNTCTCRPDGSKNGSDTPHSTPPVTTPGSKHNNDNGKSHGDKGTHDKPKKDKHKGSKPKSDKGNSGKGEGKKDGGDKPSKGNSGSTSTDPTEEKPHKLDPLPVSSGSSSSKPTTVPTSSPPSSTSSPSGSGSTSPKMVCPSGYKYADKGDELAYKDHPLVDISGIDLSIDVLGFLHASLSTGKQSSIPAKSSPKCQDECCCYRIKPSPPVTCPAGYTTYSKGDSIADDKTSLIDASGVTISLELLNYGSDKSKPTLTSTTPKGNVTCKEETCCVKQTTKEDGSIISNHKTILDASGLNVKVCLLTVCI